MRIVGFILFMIMFANTLDDLIFDIEVQIHEGKFEDTNVQRKLEENTNYMTLILNRDYKFTINKKSIIEKVIINNEEIDNLEQEIKVKEGSEIQIHFNTPLSNCSNFFKDINETIKSAIVSVDLSNFDSSNLEDTSLMFYKCSSLKSINFLNFNTAKVKNMEWMFWQCSSLEEVDLSNLDTSKVTNMRYLLSDCSSLKKANLSKLNAYNVKNMKRLFSDCSSLKEVDFSKINTSNLIDMSYLFFECSSLKEVDLSSFDTSHVKFMDSLFFKCSSLEKVNLSNFNTSSVKLMSDLFYKCTSLEKVDLSNFNTSDESILDSLFFDCSSLKEVNLSNFDTSRVKSMYSLFRGCSSLKEVDLSSFDTSHVTRMDYLFFQCSSLEKINLSNFKTPNLITMEALFYGCSKLKEADLSSFYTSKLKIISFLFGQCSSLEKVNLSNINTSNVESLENLFSGCSSLKEVDLSNFDTSKVTSMEYMFSNCKSLKKINLSNFVTSKLKNMDTMFYGCSSLSSINLSNFDTSKVTNMNNIFGGCICLIFLDISNFIITDEVKSNGKSKYFFGGKNLQYINLYNTIDNDFISKSSINKINNLKVCQKYNIITNSTAKNTCSEYNYDISKDTCYHFIDTTTIILSPSKNEDINITITYNIDSTKDLYTSTEIINEKDSTKDLYISTEIINENDSTKDLYISTEIINDKESTKDLYISTEIINDKESTKDLYISTEIINEIDSTKNLNISNISTKITNEIESTISIKDFISPSIIYQNSSSVSSNIYANYSNIPITEEINYIINSRVFLLGYTSLNIIDSNIFSFFIYFFSLKNTIQSQILNFPLTIRYNNNLRLLDNNEKTKTNCTKVEPNYEEFNKYYCTVLAKTSNIDNIELSTNFDFKPKTTFKSFYYSSLVNKSLDYFQNVTKKEYISPEVFILDNSTVYKYNNTHFEIKGIIEKSFPKFEEKAQLLIENNLSKYDKFKKLNCSLSNNKSNYNLMCLMNEKVRFTFQGSVIFTGDDIILINLENETEKITFDNSENSEEFHDSIQQKNIKKKKSSSKKWIIIIIIVSFVIFLIIIIIIIFVVRKKRNSYIQEQTASEMNLNQLNN